MMMCDGLRLIDGGVRVMYDWGVQTGAPCFVSFDWDGAMSGSVERFDSAIEYRTKTARLPHVYCEGSEMQVFVKGLSGRTVTLNVREGSTVDMVKGLL